MKCKDCKYWKRETIFVPDDWEYGSCDKEKLFVEIDDPFHKATFKEDFGCIYFEKK